MARYRPSQLIDSITGSLGSVTLTQWKGLNVVKRKIGVMSNPQTDKQTRARQNFGESSKLWSKALSQAHRDAWNNLAQHNQDASGEKFTKSTVPSVIPKRSDTMSGFNEFVRHNTARLTGQINSQQPDVIVPQQTQTLVGAGGTTPVTHEPPQKHIIPASPVETVPARPQQTPPTGIETPGQPKILSVRISDAGVPGESSPNFPNSVNGYNSPPVTAPNFVHVTVEMPSEVTAPAGDPSGVMVPSDVVNDPDNPIKAAVRLWKVGPESTGAYIIGTVPVVAATSGGYDGQRVASASASVEFIFSTFDIPSNEAGDPDGNPQSVMPIAPGLSEFQADTVNDAGQISAPSNEQKLVLGQPQNPAPGSEDDKDPNPETPFVPGVAAPILGGMGVAIGV